jgi:hypothetical protein
MGVTVVTERFALSTGSGTQDFTTSKLGGLTPKVAKFVLVSATSNDTDTTDMRCSIGACDGTREYCCGWTHDEGDSYSQRRRFGPGSFSGGNDCVIRLLDGGGSQTLKFSFNSFITNGVRLDIDDTSPSAYYVVVTFYAGSDYTGYVGMDNWPENTGAVNRVNWTTMASLTPDAIEVYGTDTNADNQSTCVMSMGFAVNDGSETQCAWTRYHWTSFPGYLQGGFHDDMIWGGSSPGAFKYTAQLYSFNSGSVTMELMTGGGTGASSDEQIYIAHNFNGVASAACGVIDAPNANGNKSWTDPGFTPQYVQLIIGNLNSTTGTWVQNNIALGAVAVYQFDDTDEYSQMWYDSNNSPYDEAGVRTKGALMNYTHQGSTLRYAGTFVSFDVNGWTTNFTTQNGVADWIFFAIEEVGGAARTPDLMPFLKGMM